MSYRNVVGKPEMKPYGTPRCIWGDNININLVKRCEDVDRFSWSLQHCPSNCGFLVV
jgi:hypothetical protein